MARYFEDSTPRPR